MGAWMWGAVVMAIVLIIAGGITWWIANGCRVAIVGAIGAILGGLAALACLAILIDPETALRVSPILTVSSAVWLLSWALASGIRAQRLARVAPATASALVVRAPETPAAELPAPVPAEPSAV